MAESVDRKVFSMGMFAAYLTGDDKDSNMAGIKEMLGYMTQLEIDNTSLPFADAIAKAWIYEQNPELLNIKGKADQFGQHVSVPVLPEGVTAQVGAIVAELKGTKAKKSKASADDPPSLSPWVLGIMVFVVIGSAIVGILSNAMNKAGP